jgi:hypothetical protein
MNLSYLVAIIGGAVMALTVQHYSVVKENSKMRLEIFGYQQALDSVQTRIQAKREILQTQQEKLAKSSSISDSVGPAIVADMAAAAVKGNNAKLRDLLQRRGMDPALAAAAKEYSQAPASRKGGN